MQKALGVWISLASLALPPAAWADEAGGGQISREEARAKIIEACKANPDQAGCVKLRAACEEKRGQWQNDMAYVCPELVGGGSSQGGGGTFGEDGPRDKTEATLDKVAELCNRQPDNRACVQIRDQCKSRYEQLKPAGQRLCRQIGAGPAAEKPIGMHTAYAFQYARFASPSKLDDNGSVIGGHLSGRGFSTDGPYASVFDVSIGKGDTGWMWEFNIGGGLGFPIGRKGTFGLVAAIGGSSGPGDSLETVWQVPVEAHVSWQLGPRLSLLGYVRPIWHISDSVQRNDGATIGSFADEFEVGAHVVFARVGAPGASNMGLMGGLVYRELVGTQFIGLRAGFGFANHP